jgi:hypothetical protein
MSFISVVEIEKAFEHPAGLIKIFNGNYFVPCGIFFADLQKEQFIKQIMALPK